MATPIELLPPGGSRKPRTAEQLAAEGLFGFDYPATQVGVAGNITVFYDSALGAPGLSLAQQFLQVAAGPYNAMQSFFGITCHSPRPLSHSVAIKL